MIELYTAATPDGQKLHIMLEDIVDGFTRESREVSFGPRQRDRS